MSKTNPHRDFSCYDTMTDARLQEILLADMHLPEGTESDTELVLYVMDLLAQRRREQNQGPDPKKAWDNFARIYMPSEEKPKKAPHRWKRLLLVAAVVSALMAGSIGVIGFEPTATEIAADWNMEPFQITDYLKGEEYETASRLKSTGFRFYDTFGWNKMEFTALDEAMDEMQFPPSLMPTWLPEGYELEGAVRAAYASGYRAVYAEYSGDAGRITINLKTHMQGPWTHQRTEEVREIYTVNDTRFYLFYCGNILSAVYLKEGIECSIRGSVDMEQMKQILDSIGG